ncbi:mitochondrial antiviral-signaling protein [Cynoglossus semilaevis]|uniref:Pollen-specific leucine-rich repeat extensin-like protein 1 n=1 Tax=Cynoglossus semilaevis TaxID=244447 RepID=A0A3P8VZV4_CYNSE|nr:pollen-specific leucine-rich repeat extensin-like protein 1 [Cynoglossus semilaevis]
MVLLLDCLKRRENWPEQFIQALEECEHSSVAAEIRAEYDALRGVDNSGSSPSATVTRAHVHPAPAASPVQESVTGSGDVATNAVVVQPTERAEASPNSAPQASPPLKAPVQPQDPNSTVQQPNNTDTFSPSDVVSPPEVISPPEAVSVPEAVSPPEAVPEPRESTQIQMVAPLVTPPPTPETPHTHREITAHQEPEENSESDIQAITGVTVLPNKINTTEMEVLTDSTANSPPSHPGGQSETNTTSDPDPSKTTSVADVQAPQIQANSDVTDGSSFLTLTPEKPPVQDTTPPVVLPVVVEPEESTEPSTNVQETESSRQTEAAASNSLPDDCATEHNTSYLSKPEVLISVQLQNHDSPSISAQTPSEEPYSGDSRRLELSTSISGSHAVSLTHVPVCSTVSFATVNTVSELTCQENSTGHDLEEPEENHYESPPDSLETEEVLVNVLQTSEEPSILNMDLPTQIINGKAAEAMAPSSPSSNTTSSSCSTADGAFGSKTVCGDISPPMRSGVVDNKPELQTVIQSEEDKRIRKFSTHTKYIVTAAGVGAIAVLMAWKFRN